MNACHEDLTLWLDEDSDELIILDQTKLPGKEETVSISTARALYDAIRTLQVRGAPGHRRGGGFRTVRLRRPV